MLCEAIRIQIRIRIRMRMRTGDYPARAFAEALRIAVSSFPSAKSARLSAQLVVRSSGSRRSRELAGDVLSDVGLRQIFHDLEHPDGEPQQACSNVVALHSAFQFVLVFVFSEAPAPRTLGRPQSECRTPLGLSPPAAVSPANRMQPVGEGLIRMPDG